MAETIDVEQAVRERYTRGAREAESNLCCAVEYAARYLEAIPQKIIERDYGCGDPHLARGDRVLDLGSGAGKLCFIASQVVGAGGRVVGIDINSEMLSLARKYAPEVAARVGYANVEFRCGKIDDLLIDYDAVDAYPARAYRGKPPRRSPISIHSSSVNGGRRPWLPMPASM